MTAALRRQLIETARAMNTSALNQGTSGNLSVRSASGMLITPSGMDYDTMAVDDIVWMGYSGACEGRVKPSSEWRFHAAIYQNRDDAQAILHAHPLHCAALACLGRGIPAFHYMVAVAGGRNIRCARYATFGTTELSENVIKALRNRKACLLAQHGLTCFEKDLPRVLALALEIEHLAAIYSQVLAIGEPELLSDTEMATVLEKFSSYGVQD